MPVIPYISTVIQSGNLTKDPEITDVNGKTLMKFSIASSKKYKQGGEWKENVGFFFVQAWGNVAEYNKTLTKGDAVIIEGSLSFSQWEDRQSGQKKTSVGIQANRIMKVSLAKKNENTENDTEQVGEMQGDGIPF